MDDHLARALALALGLTGPHARVLCALLAEADSTPAALAALAGATRPQVSAALQRLEQLGLVTVVRLQRPHLVSLVTDLEPVLARLRAAADRERADLDRQAERAVGELRRRAAAIDRTPRAPAPRRRAPGIGPGADHELLVARRSYAEVARPDGTTVRYGVPLTDRSTDRRLLVLPGRLPGRAERRWATEGVQVRFSGAELPVLVVVDAERARVEVGASSTGRHGWTFDRRQAQALLQLFDLWWDAAPHALHG